MEYKRVPYFVKELDAATRTVTGIFAVHGNVDDGYDMSEPGSFAKRLLDGSRKRVRFLWMHDARNPPIASIKAIREVGREELPTAVLDWAPEASGGVLVTRKYYEDVPLSDWVFKAIQEGDVTEMSYAYDVHEYSMKEREDGQRPIRILKDVELFDISDVNWGMNPATAGVKSLLATGLPFREQSELVVATVQAYAERVKDRKDFRESEGRGMPKGVMDGLQEMVTEIEAILASVPTPAAKAEAVRAEIAQFERINAQLRGV